MSGFRVHVRRRRAGFLAGPARLAVDRVLPNEARSRTAVQTLVTVAGCRPAWAEEQSRGSRPIPSSLARDVRVAAGPGVSAQWWRMALHRCAGLKLGRRVAESRARLGGQVDLRSARVRDGRRDVGEPVLGRAAVRSGSQVRHGLPKSLSSRAWHENQAHAEDERGQAQPEATRRWPPPVSVGPLDAFIGRRGLADSFLGLGATRVHLEQVCAPHPPHHGRTRLELPACKPVLRFSADTWCRAGGCRAGHGGRHAG